MTTERDRKSAAIAAVAVLWEERDPSFSSEASFDVPRGQGSSHAEALVRDGVVLRPDFAFVTGDFAFSGGAGTPVALAERWTVAALARAAGLSRAAFASPSSASRRCVT